MTLLLLVFTFLFPGCSRQPAEKNITINIPVASVAHVSAKVTVMPVTLDNKKSVPLVSAKKLPISENPYPKEISSELWNEFLQDMRNGQKWIWVHYEHSSSKKQYLVAYEGIRSIKTELVSGASTDECSPAWQHPDQPHNHLGLFQIFKKDVDYRSKEENCPMPYSMFYHKGHALHACMAKDICRLGGPASHGCTRQNPKDAVAMYNWAPVGTRVLITKD